MTAPGTGEKSGEFGSESVGASARRATTTILVVDDEPDTLALLSRRIEAAGYSVVTAADGMEALNKARSVRPALLILDLMLPKMDGYKVCSFLKFDERYKSIPIVLLTARANADDRMKASDVRADQFLTKPCDLKELMSVIARLAGAANA